MIWSVETPVILYGAGTRGVAVKRSLGRCNTTAFIDKRAAELKTVEGLPVYELSEAVSRENAVVVVCVNNIFDHENIVFELLKKGFEHIIFCPVDGSNVEYADAEKRRVLRDIFASIMENRLILPCELPSAAGIMSPVYSDTAVYDRDGEHIYAKIPAFFCRTRKTGNGRFSDTSVLSLFPYFEMFGWITGTPGVKPDNYLNIYCADAANELGVDTSAGWRNNVIESRREVYERMRMSEEINPLFFEQHAVLGEWNYEKRYFNLASGKHRAAYLISRGRVLIPLKIRIGDYDAYLNKPALQKLLKYLKSNGINKLPYPILHPYFYNAAYDTVCNWREQLIAAAERLGLEKFNGSGLSKPDTADFILPMLEKCGYDKRTYAGGVLDELVRELYHLT